MFSETSFNFNSDGASLRDKNGHNLMQLLKRESIYSGQFDEGGNLEVLSKISMVEQEDGMLTPLKMLNNHRSELAQTFTDKIHYQSILEHNYDNLVPKNIDDYIGMVARSKCYQISKDREVVVAYIINTLLQRVDLQLLDKHLTHRMPQHISGHLLSYLPVCMLLDDIRYERVDGRDADMDYAEREPRLLVPDSWIKNLVPVMHHAIETLPTNSSRLGRPHSHSSDKSSRMSHHGKQRQPAISRDSLKHLSRESRHASVKSKQQPTLNDSSSYWRSSKRLTDTELRQMIKWDEFDIESIPLQAISKRQTAIDDFEKRFREIQEGKERETYKKAQREKLLIKNGDKVKNKNRNLTFDYNGGQIDINQTEEKSLIPMAVPTYCTLVPLATEKKDQDHKPVKREGFFMVKSTQKNNAYSHFVKRLFKDSIGKILKADSNVELSFAAESILKSFNPVSGVKLQLNSRYIKADISDENSKTGNNVPHKLSKQYMRQQQAISALNNKRRMTVGDIENIKDHGEYDEVESKDKHSRHTAKLLDAIKKERFTGLNSIGNFEKFEQLVLPKDAEDYKVLPCQNDSGKLAGRRSRSTFNSEPRRPIGSAQGKQVRFAEPYPSKKRLPVVNRVVSKTFSEVNDDVMDLEERTRRYIRPLVNDSDPQQLKLARKIVPHNQTYRILRTHSRAQSEGTKIREKRPKV